MYVYTHLLKVYQLLKQFGGQFGTIFWKKANTLYYMYWNKYTWI